MVSFLEWAMDEAAAAALEPPMERNLCRPKVTVKTSRNFSPVGWSNKRYSCKSFVYQEFVAYSSRLS